jgi:clan AA aspartic protease (TIGR02281 family)
MSRSNLRIAIAAACLVSVVVAPVPSRGEIYTWTDAGGHSHYTQDLQSVPAEHRADARERASASPTPSKVQTFSNAPAAPAPVAGRRSAARRIGGRGGRVHRIPVERAGTGMLVMVRINGRAVAPFMVDTGASYVLIPQAVAEEAGIEVGSDTRTMQFTTANGMVEQPIVTLESVELGSAQAADVPASISPSMSIGLLGLSFLNRFTYQVDAAAGMLTLTENDLAEGGDLRGGRSENQWRMEFGGLQRRLGEIDLRRGVTPPSRSRLLAELDQQQSEAERQLESLDAEADQVNVPDSWRR